MGEVIMGENMGTVQVQAVVNRFGGVRSAVHSVARRCAICGDAQNGTSWVVLSSRQAGYLNGVSIELRTICRDCAKPKVAAQTP